VEATAKYHPTQGLQKLTLVPSAIAKNASLPLLIPSSFRSLSAFLVGDYFTEVTEAYFFCYL
jgi:hypothetical protein